MRRRIVAAALAAACLGPPARAAELGWRSEEPRPYGYVLGDLIERRLVLDVPDSEQWLESSLPTPPARAGRYFELRRLSHAAQPIDGGTRHDLRLIYQVIGVPAQIRIVELPGLPLKLSAAGREYPLTIAGPQLSIGPVSPDDGLDALQGDVPAQRIDTGAARRQSLFAAALALLLTALEAARRTLLPRLRAAARPFAAALRQLRRMRGSTAADLAPALAAIHRAFNATAGETLLPGALPAFFAAHPAYRRLDADIGAFFARSRAHLFGGEPPIDAAQACAELLVLCRRLRDVERSR